jgi:hypothetical protein
MLKITYSDSDILIEQLELTVEAIVAQRSVLALRVGQPILVEPSYGSFLLPVDLPEVGALLRRAQYTAEVEIDVCDRAPERWQPSWVEVTLRGTWIAESANTAEGILLAELDRAIEGQLVCLWQQSLRWAAESQSQRLPKAC